MPEISVILKIDDGNEYLQETVNNVFAQLFTDFENVLLRVDLRSKVLEGAGLFNESATMDKIYTISLVANNYK